MQRSEAVPVCFQCCIKERNYNAFYAQILARLCSQDLDKKRIFRLAVKKCVTERLADEDATQLTVKNTSKLCVDLVRHGAVPFVTAIRCVDFTSAAPGTPSYAFLHGLLDTFFHSSFEKQSFQRLVAEPLLKSQNRKTGTSIVLFAKHMYDNGKRVSIGEEEDGVKVKGCGIYKLADLQPRLDMLSSGLI